MSERRRGMMSNIQGSKLLYPDAYMVVFNNNAGEHSNFQMYVRSISHYIIDGVNETPVRPVSYANPTTDGDHIMYFWLNTSDRIANLLWGGPKYLRVPENPIGWHVTFIFIVHNLVRVDFLGKTPPNFDSNFMNDISSLQEIRVPIGSYDAYFTALSNAHKSIQNKIKANPNIIVETKDFNYTV